MTFMSLSQGLTPDFCQKVRLIATDMDGTLTQAGKFTPLLLQTLTDLAAASVPVLIVTGRSAGWVSSVVNYLPIAGAIAENGGIYYAADNATPKTIVALPNLIDHRQKLAQTFHRLQAEFPKIQESEDNAFRITDWTFDVQGLSPADLQQLSDRCQEQGWSFTYSTIQCHIKPRSQDKATALLWVLAHYFQGLQATQVVTVGDSPNDESLFERDRFPCSVGVANVKHYLEQMSHIPAYITQATEVEGFCELAQAVLRSNKSNPR